MLCCVVIHNFDPSRARGHRQIRCVHRVNAPCIVIAKGMKRGVAIADLRVALDRPNGIGGLFNDPLQIGTVSCQPVDLMAFKSCCGIVLQNHSAPCFGGLDNKLCVIFWVVGSECY